jgi:hypothetical protein
MVSKASIVSPPTLFLQIRIKASYTDHRFVLVNAASPKFEELAAQVAEKFFLSFAFTMAYQGELLHFRTSLQTRTGSREGSTYRQRTAN